MDYALYSPTSLAELFDDRIVYRNLVPADERVPPFAAWKKPLGLEGSRLPRKAEPIYGRVVAEMLRHARRLDLPGTEIERLVYIGDTKLNDGTAFRNLCAAGHWQGWAFIGRDDVQAPPRFEAEDGLFVANRWSALSEFLSFLEEQKFVVDEATAVVVDVDKTAVGARGRNDKVIDEARLEAVERTVANLLGPDFDKAAFRTAYDHLNQPAYHTFTADNQDYLAYICLMLGAGLLGFDALLAEIEGGAMTAFGDFLDRVHSRRSVLAGSGLLQVHEEVWACVQEGDPTPFKAFRYQEYQTTAARFRDLPGASVGEVLGQCIVLTQEVREAAAALRAQGALIFGVSDKPDEASLPTPAQAMEGFKPLHRLRTLAVGAA